MSKVSDKIQYQISGGSYSMCGETVKTLPPGFYDIVQSMRGFNLAPKTVISDDLIDIPGTVADEVFNDIDSFLGCRQNYRDYGLTHKRGYLFYGPPGSGKTSLAMMLARRFVNVIGGVVVYIDDVSGFYNAVDIIKTVEPGRPSMYLIEEADNIIDNVACLGILDGEHSLNGAVFVAMTNYKDQLPPRIANRPGRFDRVIKVDCPPEVVQIEYLRRVEARGGKHPHAPENIVKALSGIPVSMAHLREAFISHVLMGTALPEIRARFMQMAGAEPPEPDQFGWSPDDEEGTED